MSILLTVDDYLTVPWRERVNKSRRILPTVIRSPSENPHGTLIRCNICAKAVDLREYFIHLFSSTHPQFKHNEHHLALSILYYGPQIDKKLMKLYQNVPRFNAESILFTKLVDFYNGLKSNLLSKNKQHWIRSYNVTSVFEREMAKLEEHLRAHIKKSKVKQIHNRLLNQNFTKELIAQSFTIKEEYGDPPRRLASSERAERRAKIVAYYRSKINKEPDLEEVVTDQAAAAAAETEGDDTPLNILVSDQLPLDQAVNIDQCGKMSIMESQKLLKKAKDRCISMQCLITNEHTVTPVRTIDCQHAEVFCLESIKKAPKKAKCPFCGARAKLKKLTIDPLIQAFLHNEPNATIARVVKEAKKTYRLERVNDVADVVATLVRHDTRDFLMAKRAEAKANIKIRLMDKAVKISRPARGAQCEHIEVFCAKHFITSNADACPICAIPLRWDQLAIDMTLDEFIAAHPNALECDLNVDGSVTRETSFFGEEAGSDEGEVVISLPNLAHSVTAAKPTKKVFEVGLESDEEEEKLVVMEEKRNETKIGMKRYYVDVDQRKQLLDERQEQRKKARVDKQAKKRLHVVVMKQQKRQQKRINHQKKRPNEPILIE